MTDPEHMTADELEALVGEATRMSRYPRGPEVARLVLVAPVLALRLARLLRAVETVREHIADHEGSATGQGASHLCGERNWFAMFDDILAVAHGGGGVTNLVEHMKMTEPEDPIAEARRLLAALDGEWEYKKGRDNWDIHSTKKRGSAWVAEVFDERDAALIAAAPRLLAALCDRLEANEGETRTAERPDSTS